ncbi:hypothetical protein Riv7116_3096 [Rivularia sp. PCC 7116]|uniref:hypothetical protein n=1 Tax=Rivularia sp. PCC 7116 TaxID=373994 RepID=UPI00029F29E6|nr:hypothetical protein [Rivularia sp. PCC 7116]AFY55571.1 hypothetical protein Riv7116_3096 [Rivularia sp. PCC 7116]
MSIRGVRLARNRVKRCFNVAILCLSLSLTVACQQSEKTSNNSSNKNSQDSTVQPANPSNKDVVALPQKTPGEITVNLPTPFPSPVPSARSQVAPPDSSSVARAPQNFSSPPATQTNPEPNNSIPEALTEKLSPQAAAPGTIPQPQPQVETRTQPTSPKPVVQALRKAAKNPGRKIAAASNTNVYQSRRLGVNFKYPKGFVIKEPQDTSNSSKILELWSLKDYQAIESGKFKNTFTPGNMSISVEDNPRGLSLVQWVTNNDELGDIIPESYDTHIVAGKEAMSFRTDGLYDFQNLVLPNSDGKKVILISFAQGDRSYQTVFEKVVSTLQVN